MALDTEVCAEASSEQEAIRPAKRERPDLCLGFRPQVCENQR